jgi:hypothetical protein
MDLSILGRTKEPILSARLHSLRVSQLTPGDDTLQADHLSNLMTPQRTWVTVLLSERTSQSDVV